jgi:hypothetical protein
VRARVHTLELMSPEEYEAGLQIVVDDLLPWARESTGFCGALGLVDRELGKALLITLWADEETRAESAEAAERFSALAAAASGANRRPIENFNVAFFDVVREPRVRAD